MMGDGITRCDVYLYQTVFSIGMDGTAPENVDEQALIAQLLGWGVLPGSFSTHMEDIQVTLSPYSPSQSGGRRR